MTKTEHFMLDTNTASFIIRGGNPKLEAHLQNVPASALCISTVTEGELLYGLELKTGATKLKKLIQDFLLRPDILPWGSEAAMHYGVVRANLTRAGIPLASLDTMIAAHALSKKAVLVTNDGSFSRVQGLKVIDWTK
jgi:tRNA(fMet)-specific endonuclease VapC